MFISSIQLSKIDHLFNDCPQFPQEFNDLKHLSRKDRIYSRKIHPTNKQKISKSSFMGEEEDFSFKKKKKKKQYSPLKFDDSIDEEEYNNYDNKFNIYNNNPNQNEKEANNNIHQNLNMKINKSEKKYKIVKNPNCIIDIPDIYYTDNEDEYNALLLLSEDKNNGEWKLCINKPKIKISFKTIKTPNPNPKNNKDNKEIETNIFWMETEIDYSSNIVNQYMNDFIFRKKFDDLFQKGELISETGGESNIRIQKLYLYQKMPFIFGDRDFVIQKTIWNDFNNKKNDFLINFHSIKVDNYPEKKKIVRGEFYNRSAYIKYINENKCKFIFVTHFNFMLHLSNAILTSQGSKGLEDWIKNFLKTLKKEIGY